ncbi:helix-hairpin-helix domain-containing protein [Arthrobacter antioxidans]|uniref:helix-hairpin-helix domain-containing protein n=1 Tax=Arthrobacter antioxidans TaxID=2895818 RepID=UPI001FFFF681|nr:helix-hairpin-helix domain-containing protein [Arthrobacter antioxidans]
MSAGIPLPRIGAPAMRALAQVGIRTVEDLEDADLGELATLHGIGPKAIRLLRAAREEKCRDELNSEQEGTSG